MKRLISEEEIEIASRENATNMYGSKNGEHQYFNASIADFSAGALFAEEKLKDLAIEFAEWYYNWAHIDGESTIKQQFEYFIEQQK